MPIKTPKFWHEKTGVMARALTPLSCLYLAAHNINQSLKTPYRANIPVICVGNITAGGSGKTPTVLALLALIKQHDLFQNPCVLLRGYGGTLKGPSAVDTACHTSADVGDEALLLAAHHPMVIISADRAKGAMLAELSGCDVIIMDDGFQNNTLHKDISFLVVDEKQGLGNGHILPAGPLREPLSDALARTQGVILIGRTLPFETNKPVFTAQINITQKPDITTPYTAFAGIGFPEKFKSTLEQSGVMIKHFESFPDHHPYTDQDIEKLMVYGAQLITTEKDFIRIPQEYRAQIKTLPIQLVFDDPDQIKGAISP